MAMQAEDTQPPKLLTLPAEIQLYIYELVVTENKPLLLSPACDSSFRTPTGDRSQYNVAIAEWQYGIIKPPHQPALSQVCRAIRPDALKLFYRCNIFRVRYCRSTPGASNARDFINACAWVRRVGSANQANLTQLYLYDRNSSYDRHNPQDLKHAKREFEILGAKVSTIATNQCCLHRVTFGERHAELNENLTEKQIDELLRRVMDGES